MPLSSRLLERNAHRFAMEVVKYLDTMRDGSAAACNLREQAHTFQKCVECQQRWGDPATDDAWGVFKEMSCDEKSVDVSRT